MAIRIMIVDDSAVVRQVLQEELEAHPDFKVIAVAPDPLFAMEKMRVEWPDVLILDVEMPRMDGLTFLRQIMATRPTPVVICSSLTVQGADATLQALQAGAFAIVPKPRLGVRDFLRESSEDLAGTVRAAAAARVDRMKTKAGGTSDAAALVSRNRPVMPLDMTEKMVAIGCSTGGTQALEAILRALPRTSPGIAVVQHMPEAFTRAFAERLDRLCEVEVKEAQDGDRIVPGRVFIAPGGRHLLVERDGAQYRCRIKDGPLISRHRPSVDALFRSVAQQVGRNATAFILTGMGDDGARAMRELHDTGAVTYAQDEESCVVFGMPREAIRLGGVDHVVGLDRIAGIIAQLYDTAHLR